jgi:hypothetical protein
MTWNKDQALKVGENATAVSTVSKVEKKGFELGKPMLFVKQRIEVTAEGRSEPGMVEERAHVYLASIASVGSRVPRPGEFSKPPVIYLGADADTSNQ